MFELIFLSVLGAIFIFIGIRIWKCQQITLIHDYHYTHVSESDKPAYTKEVGKCCLIIGAGMLVTGMVDYIFKIMVGWTVFTTCFILGFVVFIKAQKKYNGSVF